MNKLIHKKYIRQKVLSNKYYFTLALDTEFIVYLITSFCPRFRLLFINPLLSRGWRKSQLLRHPWDRRGLYFLSVATQTMINKIISTLRNYKHFIFCLSHGNLKSIWDKILCPIFMNHNAMYATFKTHELIDMW